MSIVLLVMIIAAILALAIPMIRRALHVAYGPKELGLAKKAAKKLRETSQSTYDRSALIDRTVLAWIQSDSPRIRLVGRFLQTWEMQLTQESMAERDLNVAEPMGELHKALQRGDLGLVNHACGLLIDQVVTAPESAPTEDTRSFLIDLLGSIARHLTEGNREEWRKDTGKLKERVMALPAEIKPSIYLLVSYLESPLQQTEVFIDRDALADQTNSLANLVGSIANRLDRGIEQSSSDLLTILGQYEKSIRPAARSIGQAVT